jgi:hypothetical protein
VLGCNMTDESNAYTPPSPPPPASAMNPEVEELTARVRKPDFQLKHA